MAEQTYAGMKVTTGVKMIDGKPVFMVECIPEGAPEGLGTPTVYITWSAGFERFGVFVNEELTYPLPEGAT